MRCNSLDDLDSVDKKQVNKFSELDDEYIVINTQGLSDKLVLSPDDITHLQGGGLIVAAVNLYEYCIVITLDKGGA